MGKKKKELGFDSDGAKKVMRKRDYMADMSGQLALGLMANVVGQLTYFYTDKVGLAVGGVGIVMAIAKVIDALTDIWFGTINEQISNFAQTYPTNLKASSNEALLFMRRYRFANCSCFSCCFKDAYPSSNVQ